MYVATFLLTALTDCFLFYSCDVKTQMLQVVVSPAAVWRGGAAFAGAREVCLTAAHCHRQAGPPSPFGRSPLPALFCAQSPHSASYYLRPKPVSPPPLPP